MMLQLEEKCKRTVWEKKMVSANINKNNVCLFFCSCQSVTVEFNEDVLSCVQVFNGSSVYEHSQGDAITDASKGIGTSDALTCPNSLRKSQTSFPWNQTGTFQKTVVLCGLNEMQQCTLFGRFGQIVHHLVNAFMQEKHYIIYYIYMHFID